MVLFCYTNSNFTICSQTNIVAVPECHISQVLAPADFQMLTICKHKPTWVTPFFYTYITLLLLCLACLKDKDPVSNDKKFNQGLCPHMCNVQLWWISRFFFLGGKWGALLLKMWELIGWGHDGVCWQWRINLQVVLCQECFYEWTI